MTSGWSVKKKPPQGYGNKKINKWKVTDLGDLLTLQVKEEGEWKVTWRFLSQLTGKTGTRIRSGERGGSSFCLIVVKASWISVLFFLMFIYFWERDKESTWKSEGGTERGGRGSEVLCCQQRAWHRAQTHKPWGHDLSRSLTLNRLSHPDTPLNVYFRNKPLQVGKLNFSSICTSRPIQAICWGQVKVGMRGRIVQHKTGR